MKWTPSVIDDDNATDQCIDNLVGKLHLKEINEREEYFTSGASINVSVVHALSDDTCRTVAYVPSDGESEYYNKQIVVNGQAFDKFHEIGWENKFTSALNKKQFSGGT